MTSKQKKLTWYTTMRIIVREPSQLAKAESWTSLIMVDGGPERADKGDAGTRTIRVS